MPGLRLILAAVLAIAGGAARAGADIRIDGGVVIAHLVEIARVEPSAQALGKAGEAPAPRTDL